MKRLTWRDKAIRSIANALLEYEAQCLLMGESLKNGYLRSAIPSV
jgi:hypothetical protein